MGLRRVLSILSLSIVATGSIVAAAPKKGAPAPKGPMAPAKDPAPAAGSGSGSAAAPAPDAGSGSGSGSAVQMTEDAPPSDMNGTDENPDAPKGVSGEETVVKVAAPPKKAEKYPIEEALRPINLPQNMSEVSISPHAQLGDGSAYPYAGGDALRARYGITNQVQLGFTYVFAGIYPNPMDVGATGFNNYALHTGKALGLDVQVAITDFLSVKLGVPVYLDPVAVSIAVGAPMKFKFGDKFAIGGLDDLLNVKVSKFAPSYYQEYQNAVAAYEYSTNTVQQNGHLRFSIYGDYQLRPNLAVIGRTGLDVSLSADSSGAAGNNMGVGSGTATFLRGALQWTPRRFIDLGFGLGFDDLGHIGSFGPQGILALRI